MTIKEQKRQWYLNNKDKVQEQHRQYALIHKAEKKESARLRYIRDKDKLDKKNKEWRLLNKTKFVKLNVKGHLKRKYGITLEQYDLMLTQQNGCCAICGKSPTDIGRKLDVDHNHFTDAVRGLLCPQCNCGIGNLQENLVLLDNAKKYLQKYN